MRLGWVLLIGLLLAAPEPGPSPPRYECELKPGPLVRVRVYRVDGKRRQPIGPKLVYRHRGKMASAADVDEDGCVDLLVLVHKTTRYDPRPGWRPFVYTLGNDEWVPKWLGSRVGRPLLEAALVHTPDGVRLLTIEDFGDGQTGLTLYHWRGFGFWGEWTGAPGQPQSGLKVSDADGDGIDEISVRIGDRRKTYVLKAGGCTAAKNEEDEGKS
jgi:hypothetical protein